MDIFGLDAKLNEVISMEGVEDIGALVDKKFLPFHCINGKGNYRLIAVQNQFNKASVIDVSSDEMYQNTLEQVGSVNVKVTYLLKVQEEAVDDFIKTMASNENINFYFSDKTLVRPERN